MSDKRVKIMIAAVFLLVTLIMLLIVYFINREEADIQKQNVTIKYVYDDVYDVNEYYSVAQSIKDYYLYIQMKDYGSVLKQLSEQYINTQRITSNNINEYVETNLDNIKYTPQDIKVYKNSYYNIYYIKGIISEDTDLEDYNEYSVSHIVIQDIIHFTYSIIPINNDKKDIKSIVSEYSLENYDQAINDNGTNQISNISVSENDFIISIYENYKKLLVNDCESAYKKIDSSTKKKYPKYENFKEYCKKFEEKYIDSIINDYTIVDKNYMPKYSFKDQYNNAFEIKMENAVDYTVTLIK